MSILACILYRASGNSISWSKDQDEDDLPDSVCKRWMAKGLSDHALKCWTLVITQQLERSLFGSITTGLITRFLLWKRPGLRLKSKRGRPRLDHLIQISAVGVGQIDCAESSLAVELNPAVFLFLYEGSFLHSPQFGSEAASFFQTFLQIQLDAFHPCWQREPKAKTELFNFKMLSRPNIEYYSISWAVH